MSLREFIRSLNSDGVEGELIKTVFVSLITSFLLLSILYYFRLKDVDDFISKYGFYVFFVVLSYAFILPSVRQVKAYEEFPCMSGMMIGMTIGMVSGFLLGFFVGATNGMFYGSIFGMAIGISLGIWNGKCCGIMGVMEGVMAGFMGGLMGAMTSLMMINDNLKATGIIIFLISSSILFGLNYMIYNETREIKRKHKDDEMFNIVISFILTAITTWVMVFGPRSVLLQ